MSVEVMSLVNEMRRNKKIFLALLVSAIVVYYLIWPRAPENRMVQVDDGKPRFPVSHFLQDIKTNEALFRAVTKQNFIHKNTSELLPTYILPNDFSARFSPKELNVTSDFNIEKDVLVYLHIQKVGGTTFNYHLMNDLNIPKPCRCEKDMITNPCYCKNSRGHIWLFSWFSVGWPCGLHADWTMLHECVDDVMNMLEGINRPRRYYYITLLRDPITRYLSEWQHQRSGQHWQDAKLRCNHQPVSMFDVRPCFNTRTWSGVPLDEFMECSDNLATNRQTRMLADLTKSHCYHRNEMKYPPRGRLQIQSALENLKRISFFGLTEFQEETQKLFERTFGIKFKRNFERLDEPEDALISEDEFIRMFRYIELDIILYQNAKELFRQRFEKSR